MDGCAKKIVAMAKEAGLVLTGAGATYPYGKDPDDKNIRIGTVVPDAGRAEDGSRAVCGLRKIGICREASRTVKPAKGF